MPSMKYLGCFVVVKFMLIDIHLPSKPELAICSWVRWAEDSGGSSVGT